MADRQAHTHMDDSKLWPAELYWDLLKETYEKKLVLMAIVICELWTDKH